MTIGNTSELGGTNRLNTVSGQIVKTPPVPLLPASVTASASRSYSLKQDIDGIADGTDDGTGLNVTFKTEGTCDGATLGVAVKVKAGNKQESASKGTHNPDPSSKMSLQVPLPPTFSDPKLSSFTSKVEISSTKTVPGRSPELPPKQNVGKDIEPFSLVVILRSSDVMPQNTMSTIKVIPPTWAIASNSKLEMSLKVQFGISTDIGPSSNGSNFPFKSVLPPTLCVCTLALPTL
mmetsp:Transcript_25655/g.32680  ORF Transcript_25655/g.32680 Transcript_25655/m.32680 type:complete len:234 (+) Transcript_25655:717-1418(+)